MSTDHVRSLMEVSFGISKRKRIHFHRTTSKTPATCQNQCPTSVAACTPTQSRTTSQRIFPQILERTSLCPGGSPQCRTQRRSCISHWSRFTGDLTLRNSSRDVIHLAEHKLTCQVVYFLSINFNCISFFASLVCPSAK